MTNPQDLVAEFHFKYQQEPDPKLQMTLIREEFLELQEALELGDDPYDVAKELGDLLYVTYGLAHMLGVDSDKVFSAVHKSNMSKSGVRDDGKILKGPDYVPAIFHRNWFL